jgi:hypothetical protein
VRVQIPFSGAGQDSTYCEQSLPIIAHELTFDLKVTDACLSAKSFPSDRRSYRVGAGRVAEILQGWEWNEAILQGPDRVRLDEGLVSILAFGSDRSPKLIGTAFIAGSYGSHAVAVSAAHNFHIAVRSIQNPNPRYHPSALTEFLPNAEVVDLDRRTMRALYRVGDHCDLCVISSLVWERASDLAILTLHAQDASDSTLFNSFLPFDNARPRVGDTVGVLGYADMATLNEYRDKNFEAFALQRRLVLRAGRVTASYPEGHLLCRGPCVETTIPVFPGMSGGPACLSPQPNASIVPFGFISSDPDESVAAKNDRSRAGSSIISLLPHEISNETKEKRDVIFRLADVSFVRNTEFDRPTS